MAKNFTEEDNELLTQLGVEVRGVFTSVRTPREERIVDGFEEIQRFTDEFGRPPSHGENRDIFERLYAMRLDRIREQNECRALVAPFDHQSLIAGGATEGSIQADELDDSTLLSELGVGAEVTHITTLQHVRPVAQVKAASEVANRRPCIEFKLFESLFEQVQRDLQAGTRQTRRFEMKSEIQTGRFFIVGGQIAYVAEMAEVKLNGQGRTDARLRVIFDNGTESNMLMRSLQRALNKDNAGRRISDSVAGPLFSSEYEDGDRESGTVYVLRSRSSHPIVQKNRELVHKIGVTTMSVEERIAGARLQPTFLMADVDIVATYMLFNINQIKLEKIFHRIFNSAKLNIEVTDRFGNIVVPQEWFLVPLFIVDEVVGRIKDGTIHKFAYDPEVAKLVMRGNVN